MHKTLPGLILSLLLLAGCNRSAGQTEPAEAAPQEQAAATEAATEARAVEPAPPSEPATAEASGDREYAERMAQEHATDQPVPSEAAQAAPQHPVTTEEVVYATIGEQSFTGHLARPEGATGSLPGLVVIHEWWGLNDNIRSMADQLAGEGYVALAVDLYGGQAAETPENAMAMMQGAMENAEQLEENLRQAVAYLQAANEGGPLGVIGWCFGGGWSLRTALMMPEALDATVIYYGRLVTDRDQLARLDMPILGIFGGADEGIPLGSVRDFEAALGELGKTADIRVYEGADHAFANPSGHNYQAEAAEDAWNRTLAFFEAQLR